jgi:hypothetical protein
MDEAYTELESRITALEKENRQFFRWGWIIVVTLNVLTLIKVGDTFLRRIPGMERMFVEMLAGEILPLTTRLSIGFGKVPVIISAILVVIIIVWGRKGSKQHLPKVLGFGVAVWCVQMIFLAAGTHAQFAPLIKLIERLG